MPPQPHPTPSDRLVCKGERSIKYNIKSLLCAGRLGLPLSLRLSNFLERPHGSSCSRASRFSENKKASQTRWVLPVWRRIEWDRASLLIHVSRFESQSLFSCTLKNGYEIVHKCGLKSPFIVGPFYKKVLRVLGQHAKPICQECFPSGPIIQPGVSVPRSQSFYPCAILRFGVVQRTVALPLQLSVVIGHSGTFAVYP